MEEELRLTSLKNWESMNESPFTLSRDLAKVIASPRHSLLLPPNVLTPPILSSLPLIYAYICIFCRRACKLKLVQFCNQFLVTTHNIGHCTQGEAEMRTTSTIPEQESCNFGAPRQIRFVENVRSLLNDNLWKIPYATLTPSTGG